MRSVNQICVAVNEGQPVTEEELKCAVASLSSIEHFIKSSLRELVEDVDKAKPLPVLKMRARFSKELLERMFTAGNRAMDQWLGPDNIPGSPGQQARLKAGKALCLKATGVNLDQERAKFTVFRDPTAPAMVEFHSYDEHEGKNVPRFRMHIDEAKRVFMDDLPLWGEVLMQGWITEVKQ